MTWRAAVVGGGTMGLGIGRWLADHGCDVLLSSRRPEARERFLGTFERRCARRVRSGRMTVDDQAEQLARVRAVDTIDRLGDPDIVIEAVSENLGLKAQVLESIERVVAPNALIATTTSSLTVREVASKASRPERVLGAHFFNPVSLIRIVEVAHTPVADPESVRRALRFVEEIGKTPLAVRDRTGFVVNRVLCPFLFEAVESYMEHATTPAAMDRECVDWGMSAGPCTLADLVGLDVLASVSESFESALGPCYRCPPLLERLVAEGRFGRKTGSGIFSYAHGQPEPDPRVDEIRAELEGRLGRPEPTSFHVNRLFYRMLHEVAACLEEDATSREGLDLATREVLGAPTGLLTYYRTQGPDAIAAELDALAAEVGPRFAMHADIVTVFGRGSGSPLESRA